MLGGRGGLNIAVLFTAVTAALLVAAYLFRGFPTLPGKPGSGTLVATHTQPTCPACPMCPTLGRVDCHCHCQGGNSQTSSSSFIATPAPVSNSQDVALPSYADNGYAPPCQPGCGSHGQCFLSKCFCYAGYQGEECDTPTNPPAPTCKKDNDACYQHPINGRMVVPMERWHQAHTQESGLWASVGGSDDRSADHVTGFKRYKDLPSHLGDVIEIGCGPFTQTRAMLGVRPDIQINSLTLEDPGLLGYVAKTVGCTYKTGKLRKWQTTGDDPANFHTFPMVFINAGGEQLTHLQHYDTVFVANVVEHVWNGYDLWQNLYNVVRPGGLLIFVDKYFDGIPLDYWHSLDSIYHPVRPFKNVLDFLLSKFEPIAQYHNDLPGVIDGSVWHKQGYYFVGRKPLRFREE